MIRRAVSDVRLLYLTVVMSRLFVIPARDEPVAVVFRRGPARWYHVIEWHTRRDTFVHGAWIKGRIYEEKCDLSPDGRLLLYFIHQGSRWGTPFSNAWTAVSRTPWLTALVVWPEGTTYGGGGRFLDNRRLSIRSVTGSSPFVPDSKAPVRGIEVTPGAPAPLHTSDGEISDVDWSGRDHRGNAVFTRGHRLYRRMKGDDNLLADFSQLKPDPHPAPDWATRPL
jgi:hypothetical protein